MTKKIPCRVIRSVALNQVKTLTLYSFPSDDKFTTDDVVNVDVCVRHVKSLPNCPGFLNISKAAVCDGLVGRILDCYV